MEALGCVNQKICDFFTYAEEHFEVACKNTDTMNDLEASIWMRLSLKLEYLRMMLTFFHCLFDYLEQLKIRAISASSYHGNYDFKRFAYNRAEILLMDG
jgi:hypothetical protein